MKPSHPLSLFKGRRFPFTTPLAWQWFLTACLYFLTVPTFALTPLTGVTQIWSQGKGSQSSHSCAILSGGGVKCWGNNWFGELGDGSTIPRYTPVAVSGLTSGVTAIALGHSHSCALTSGGGVKCWGSNGNGELGDGSTTNRLTPVAVSGLTSGVTAIALGYSHSCALTSGGGVKCWGNNVTGQLGDGSTTNRYTPVAVSGLTSGVTAIALGSGHTCALTGGGVKCWGSNGNGELGSGSAVYSNTPVAVSGLTSGVTAIALGSSRSCALTSGGGVKCWGVNDCGQLSVSTTPVAVSGLTSGVTAIALGGWHRCALTSGGGVKCSGNNADGQLGNGSTVCSNTPVAVSGLTSGVTAIALGSDYSCALTSSGGVKCWGTNGGMLGDNTTTDRLTPVDVLTLQSNLTLATVGTGTVSSSGTPAGTSCGTNCLTYLDSTAVTLNATPGNGFTFSGWSCTPAFTSGGTLTANTTCTATFVPVRYNLTLATVGTGTVSSSGTPAGTSCGTNCLNYPNTTAVTLNASPAAGFTFSSWSCTPTFTSGNRLTANTTCTATFTPTFNLTLATVGTGTVSSSGTPAGTSCGTNCLKYLNTTTVTLNATPASGFTFSSWSCTPTFTSGNRLTANTTCTATFTPTFNLALATVGTGTVSSSGTPAGTACGTDCLTYLNTTAVTLNATPASGFTFSSWSCTPTFTSGNRLTANTTCTATFTLTPTFKLTLATVGTGTISSSGIPAGTFCGTNCLKYPNTTAVTLNATPASGFTFSSWSCTPTFTSVNTLTANTTCTATFTPITSVFNLTLATVGTGTVSSAGTPAGTSCGANCLSYPSTTAVTLNATPGSGFTLSGWSCTPTFTSGNTLTANTACTATFTPTISMFNLTLATVGTGTVSSSGTPAAGTSCGTNCLSYPNTTAVTLNATPGSGFIFGSWNCTPTFTSGNSLTTNTTCTATFTPTFNLALATVGTGTVSSSGTPVGTACGTDCLTYPNTTTVTLNATPGSGFIFGSWNCTPTFTSGNPLTANTTCTATFIPTFNLTLATVGTGTVSSSGTPAGTACGTDCLTYPSTTPVTLIATPGPGFTFDNWNCTPAFTSGNPLTANTTCTATFTPTFNLTLTTVGTGTVSSFGTPVGTACGTDCLTYPNTTAVTLNATPGSGFVFSNWSCTPAFTSGNTLTAHTTCTATFTPAFNLTLVTAAGTGTVSSSGTPAGTACGTDCLTYLSTTAVTLTATPGSGFALDNWNCTPAFTSGNKLTAHTICAATFTPAFDLTLTTVDTGTVSSTGTPAGIPCGIDCLTYPNTTAVTLTATPALGFNFDNWNCTPAFTSGNSLTANTTCTATFTPAILCVAQTEISAEECYVLIDLYNNTGGANWTDSATHNWNVTTTPCSWTGVTCEGGMVTSIDRSNQNLTGSLPASVSTLTSLTTLKLNDNRLSGGLPNLPARLTVLYLQNNQLSGIIPDLDTTALVAPNVDFSCNQFTGEIGTSATLRDPDWATTQCFPTPEAPTNLTATAVSDTQIDLSWTDNSTIETGFQIESPAGTVIHTTATNVTNYSHTGLTCNTTYTYQLTAIGATKDSTALTATATTASCSTSATQVLLTIALNGRGKVKAEGLTCTATTCTGTYLPNTTLTLQAQPSPSWIFGSWSGACVGNSNGQMTLTTDATCNVTFLEDPNIPNEGDGNGDGLKDAYQDNVASIPDKLTNQYVTTEVDENCTIDTMSSEMLDQVPDAGPAYRFYQGLLYFDIMCPATKVTFYYHSINKIIARFVMQKYGPKIPGDFSTLGWYILPDAVFDTVKIGKQTVMRASYSLIDGEFGDNTGVDGHIIDPVGVAEVK